MSVIGIGGLRLARYRNQRCPTIVVQRPVYRSSGLPVTFSPVGSEESVINVSSPVNIKFEITQECAKSTGWKVGKIDPSTQSNLLEIGGEEGSVDSTFKIEKGSFSFTYEIKDASGRNYLITHIAEGKSIVTVGSKGNPFNFVFRKAASMAGNGNQGELAKA